MYSGTSNESRFFFFFFLFHSARNFVTYEDVNVKASGAVYGLARRVNSVTSLVYTRIGSCIQDITNDTESDCKLVHMRMCAGRDVFIINTDIKDVPPAQQKDKNLIHCFHKCVSCSYIGRT